MRSTTTQITTTGRAITPLGLRRWPTVALLALQLTLTSCLPPSGSTPLDNLTQFQLTPVASLAAVALEPGARLHVIATTSIVGDVVGQVGGEAIDLKTLMPPGVDPHTYEPAPRDIQALARADVVFLNGLGLEGALLPRLANADGRAAVVSLSEGITPRSWRGNTTPVSGADAVGPSEAGVDPHVWQNPRNVVRWAENAAEALARLDPAGGEGYRRRAAAYATKLRQLDVEIEAMVETIPPDRRRLVTDHDDLGYFADRYGFEIVGAVIPAYSTSTEPSAQDIARLEAAVRQLGVKAVFVGIESNQALSSRVAHDTGVRLVPIYAASLSPPDGPAPSYAQLMLYNVNAIVAGLRGIGPSP